MRKYGQRMKKAKNGTTTRGRNKIQKRSNERESKEADKRGMDQEVNKERKREQ
jgi:hypothetical protein